MRPSSGLPSQDGSHKNSLRSVNSEAAVQFFRRGLTRLFSTAVHKKPRLIAQRQATEKTELEKMRRAETSVTLPRGIWHACRDQPHATSTKPSLLKESSTQKYCKLVHPFIQRLSS